MSTMNGKCKSDKEQRHINTIHTNRGLDEYRIKAAKISQQEELLPGIVSMENGMGSVSSGGLSSGVMALIIICSVSIFIFLVVIGIFKYRQ